jgi:hypothetical protein
MLPLYPAYVSALPLWPTIILVRSGEGGAVGYERHHGIVILAPNVF